MSMSKELVDNDGYEPDEMRSLARWMLRSEKLVTFFIEDETQQFYWLDRLKHISTKNPYYLLKSIVEDHATAPNSLIERVLDFIDTDKGYRDPYVAVHLMKDISRVPVDRNLSRAHDLAVRDDALDTMECKIDWEEGTKEDSEKEMEAQDKFFQTCEESNHPIPLEKARELCKLVLRLQQLSLPKYKKDYLDPLWSDLLWYVDHIDADDDLKKRMLLIKRAYDFTIPKWRQKELMMLLWAIYSLMEVATVPEPPATKFESIIHKTLKSRDTKTRLLMPVFAVDVTTKRGQHGMDTTKRLLNKKLIKLIGSESELRKKYDPICASHGPSPHDTLQTMADFKAMIAECERMQSSSLVPKLFEMPHHEEGTEKRGDDEEEQEMKRLKNDAWRAVMQVADVEVVDDALVDTLPRTTSRSVKLDFEKGVSYEGPLNPTVALGALSVSRLGIKLGNLESVPKVRLLLNAAKNKIYLEKALFGSRPEVTDTDTDLEEEVEAQTEERSQVTLLQRSLHRATNTNMMTMWWRKCSLEMIKMFIFRRLVGMSCSPAKCLVHGPTGNIQMADLYSSPKDYKRCQTTVRKESADWLFDSSSHQKFIRSVSSALTEDKDCIAEVISWLSKILDRQAFKNATASILEPYVIPFEDFKENVRAVMHAYGVVPETDDEDED